MYTIESSSCILSYLEILYMGSVHRHSQFTFPNPPRKIKPRDIAVQNSMFGQFKRRINVSPEIYIRSSPRCHFPTFPFFISFSSRESPSPTLTVPIIH